jgi:hypothetical protein
MNTKYVFHICLQVLFETFFAKIFNELLLRYAETHLDLHAVFVIFTQF